MSIMKTQTLNLPGIITIKGFCLPIEYSESVEKDSYPDGYIVITEILEKDIESITNKYLSSKGGNCELMNPTIRSKIIFGVACIMKHLHKKKIAHKNLNNNNVFLDENLEPKIGFQFNNIISLNPDDDYFYMINFYYFPPEYFMNEDYDDYDIDVKLAFDVYSYGFFLYKMFSSSFEYQPNLRGNKIFMIHKRGLRPKRPENIPNCYWDLIEECWKTDPNQRPSFDEITRILKNDQFAIEEFGLKTNLKQLHEYQNRLDS